MKSDKMCVDKVNEVEFEEVEVEFDVDWLDIGF